MSLKSGVYSRYCICIFVITVHQSNGGQRIFQRSKLEDLLPVVDISGRSDARFGPRVRDLAVYCTLGSIIESPSVPTAFQSIVKHQLLYQLAMIGNILPLLKFHLILYCINKHTTRYSPH